MKAPGDGVRRIAGVLLLAAETVLLSCRDEFTVAQQSRSADAVESVDPEDVTLRLFGCSSVAGSGVAGSSLVGRGVADLDIRKTAAPRTRVRIIAVAGATTDTVKP